ncbi:MAG: ornithine carbamoyltransferase [Bacillota bacterium]
MAKDLKGRDFVSLHDFTAEEIWQILETARASKLRLKTGLADRPLEGKTLGMIFTKPSTRTRISFEVGIWQLGGVGLFLSANELQLRRGETIDDTARVLSRYLDGIMIRTYDHEDVVDLARYSDIPVINGLTDLLHPCQAASDLLTIWEKLGRIENVKLAFTGDGNNNMVHSLMFAGAKIGLDVRIASPEGHQPDREVTEMVLEDARKSGARITITEDPAEAVRGADVVYADVWTSMGQEEDRTERLEVLQPYQVNSKLWAEVGDGAIFMHCLPAHREEEVTTEIIDGPMSVVFDQAENRLHAQKAIMALTM